MNKSKLKIGQVWVYRSTHLLEIVKLDTNWVSYNVITIETGKDGGVATWTRKSFLEPDMYLSKKSLWDMFYESICKENC